MSIHCVDYLKKLEKERIVRRRFPDGNSLLYLNEQVHRPDCFLQVSKNMLYTLDIPDRDLYLYIKRYSISGECLKDAFTYEILFSRLFNELGVNALNYYLLTLTKPQDINCYDNVVIASENLNKVDGLEFDYIKSHPEFYDFLNSNRNVISDLLKHRKELSDSCENANNLLDGYIKTSLLEIICMMLDNHINNKRLVKKKHGEYEDILAFDFEDTGLDLFKTHDDYENFKCSLTYAADIFAGVTPLDNSSTTYMDYLETIKYMYLSGKLPQSSMELIKKLQSINVDEIIRQAEKTTGFKFPEVRKTFFKKLIDVNQEYFADL